MSTKKWSVEDGDSIKIVDESGACIASMPRWSRFSSEEQLGNALLMASASSLKEQNAELLAALKNACTSLEWTVCLHPDIPANSEFMTGLRETRALIATAEKGDK